LRRYYYLGSLTFVGEKDLISLIFPNLVVQKRNNYGSSPGFQPQKVDR